MAALTHFKKDDGGSVLVEYGMIALCVSVVILASLSAIFGKSDNIFGRLLAGFL